MLHGESPHGGSQQSWAKPRSLAQVQRLATGCILQVVAETGGPRLCAEYQRVARGCMAELPPTGTKHGVLQLRLGHGSVQKVRGCEGMQAELPPVAEVCCGDVYD